MARLYETAQPDVVIHLAAEVGGIGANIAHPGRFFFATMAMGLQLVEHARRCCIEAQERTTSDNGITERYLARGPPNPMMPPPTVFAWFL